MATTTRKLAAIMFTDIVGYTALMGSDEDRAFEVLARNREIHSKLIAKYHGTLIKEMGDGMLISFNLASEAVRCAIEIQKACKTHEIPLKIGIHEGEVVFKGNDVLGDGVNIASRIQDGAETGCIMISNSVFRDIKNKANIKTEFITDKRFKNVDESIKIYQVISDIKDNTSKNTFLEKELKSKYPYFIITGLMLVTIIFLLMWKIIPFKPKIELEKSIAVLPLNYLSANQEKEYWAEGITEALTSHLSKIEGLRVLPRTSAEKFRNLDKTASEIGDELNVSYLIEGSLHLEGENKIRLTIQLINAHEESHLFAEEYDREVKDIFKVQSSIAKLIAQKIEVIITPKEKDLIEKIPTENLTAYDLYLKARSEPDIDKAILLYNLVLDFDSTFALAYTGLAQRYWQKHRFDTYFKEDYLDSSLILANIALSYDDQLDEGYLVRGKYFSSKGQYNEALKNYEKAVDINPNAADIWYEMSNLYIRKDDYLKAMTCLKITNDIDYNQYHNYVIERMAFWLRQVGLAEKSKDYFKKIFLMKADSLGNIDSIEYKIYMLQIKHYYSLNDSLLSLYEIAYNRDTIKASFLHELGYQYMFHRDYDKAYYYINKHKDLVEKLGSFELVRTHRMGYVAWQLGKYEEAEEYFNTQLYHCKESIRLKRPYGLHWAYYDLAGIYAFKGEKELAYENLDKFEKVDFEPIWLINLAKNDPMFDGIRDEPRFRQIIQNMETKNRKERERVRAWVEENNML